MKQLKNILRGLALLSLFIFSSCIYNRLLLNILYVINQKYGLNL